MPELIIDNFKEYNITINRKVRKYERYETDENSPILIEFYKKNNKFISIDPLIANAVILDYSTNMFINNIKNAHIASHFIVFVEPNVTPVIKYLTYVPLHKELNEVLKSIVENNMIVYSYDTVENFVNESEMPPEPEYEDLIVSLNIFTTKDSILYLDEDLPIKCVVDYTSGSNDWFIYKYKWNVTTDDSQNIIINTEGRKNIAVNCEVEFRLKEEPTNSNKNKKVSKIQNFNLVDVPEPGQMNVTLTIKCADIISGFLIDHNYLFELELSNLSGFYQDWQLENIIWNYTDNSNNLYQLMFTPTENVEYNIEAEAIYKYKRNTTKKCSFKTIFKKTATYPFISADLDLKYNANNIFTGDTLEIIPEISNILNDAYWEISNYLWTSSSEDLVVTNTENDKVNITFESSGAFELKCQLFYQLKSNNNIKTSIQKIINFNIEDLNIISCLLNIDCVDDSILIDEYLILRLNISNVLNAENWKIKNITWTGAVIDADDNFKAVFKMNNTGLYTVNVEVECEDIFNKGKSIKFLGTRNILVEYTTDSIGDIDIYLDKETVYYGDNLNLNFVTLFNNESDAENWDLISTEWKNALKDENNINKATINNITETTNVEVEAIYKSKIYTNVEKHIISNINIEVVDLPELIGNIILFTTPENINKNESAILSMTSDISSETLTNWEEKEIIWKGAIPNANFKYMAEFEARNIDGIYVVEIEIVYASTINNTLRSLTNTFDVVVNDTEYSELERLQAMIGDKNLLVEEYLAVLLEKIQLDFDAETDDTRKTVLETMLTDPLNNVNKIYTKVYYKGFLDDSLKNTIAIIDINAKS